MKKLMVIGLIVVAAIVVYFVVVASIDDLDGLSGEWVAVSLEIEGEKLDAKKLKGMKVQFAKDKVTWFMPTDDGDIKPLEGPFRYDPSTKPKSMDIAQPIVKGLFAKSIYEIKGDTLRICMSDERPEVFSNRELMLWTFKRQ